MSTPLSSLIRRFLALAALSAAPFLLAQEREYSFADATVEDEGHEHHAPRERECTCARLFS